MIYNENELRIATKQLSGLKKKQRLSLNLEPSNKTLAIHQLEGQIAKYRQGYRCYGRAC
jgi:hypothetical protein